MKILKRVKHKPRFVIRTVRNGEVKVLGWYFTPREPYTGELDGKRMAFGIYYTGDTMMDTLFLWGTEAMYSASSTEEYKEAYKNQPNIDISGTIHWQWWDVNYERA